MSVILSAATMDGPRCSSTGNEGIKGWECMTVEELELQYSPSRHSPYQLPDDVIPAYLAKVKEDIVKSRAKVPWMSYALDPGAESSLRMDVYGEDLPKEAPLLVFVHGGYWQELSRELVGGLMVPLYRAGVMTAVLSYTLAPAATVWEMVREVERGLRRCVVLVQERGASTIVVAGWSAGAQLVAQALSACLAKVNKASSEEAPLEAPKSEAGSHSSRDTAVPTDQKHPGSWQEVKGVISISGIYDLRPLVPTYINDPLKMTSEDAWQLSPANPSNCRALLSTLPPSARCLIALAAHDSPQFRRQAEHYATSLRSAGLKNVEEHIVMSSDHFKIISDLADEDNPFTKHIIQFIKECI